MSPINHLSPIHIASAPAATLANGSHSHHGCTKRRKGCNQSSSDLSQALTPSPTPSISPRSSPSPDEPLGSPAATSIPQLISQVDAENTTLKARLLSLVHDYKQLRQAVLSGRHDARNGATSTTHKRCITERLVEDALSIQPAGEMDGLVSEMLVLSHDTFASFIDYNDMSRSPDPVLAHEPAFSMTSSSSLDLSPDSHDDGEHSVFDDDDDDGFSSLTRSTTVLLVGTVPTYIKRLPMPLFKTIEERLSDPFGHQWAFEDSMNIPDHLRDNYLMVTDLLEEQLLYNEMRYYTEPTAQF